MPTSTSDCILLVRRSDLLSDYDGALLRRQTLLVQQEADLRVPLPVHQTGTAPIYGLPCVL
jgi:hypothetical protein